MPKEPKIYQVFRYGTDYSIEEEFMTTNAKKAEKYRREIWGEVRVWENGKVVDVEIDKKLHGVKV